MGTREAPRLPCNWVKSIEAFCRRKPDLAGRVELEGIDARVSQALNIAECIRLIEPAIQLKQPSAGSDPYVVLIVNANVVQKALLHSIWIGSRGK